MDGPDGRGHQPRQQRRPALHVGRRDCRHQHIGRSRRRGRILDRGVRVCRLGADGVGIAPRHDGRLEVGRYAHSHPHARVRLRAGGRLHRAQGRPLHRRVRARVSVSNFSTVATFDNPYAQSVGGWDYGFLFRSAESNTFHIIVVTDDRRWFHYVRNGSVESEPLVDSGSVVRLADERRRIERAPCHRHRRRRLVPRQRRAGCSPGPERWSADRGCGRHHRLLQ